MFFFSLFLIKLKSTQDVNAGEIMTKAVMLKEGTMIRVCTMYCLVPNCVLKLLWFAHLFAVNLNICNIVLKHSGNVDFWKLVFAEHDKQTGFTARSISYNHQLFANCCHA